MQHVHEHRLVARGHQDDVRQAAQVGDVERTVVGGAVVADQAGAVHREDDVELLQADVVDDLVVGALQERRVDRGHRLAALQRETGREQDRLLLGDADVVIAVGQLALEDVQAGARVHRGGDPDHALVAPALAARSASPNTWVYCGGARLGAAPAFGPPRPPGAPLAIDLGLAACHFSIPSRPPSSAGAKPLPLTVAQWTTTGRSRGQRLAQRAAQRADVVAVDHAHVGEVELLPPQAGRPERLDRLLEVRTEPLERGADPRRELRQAALDLLAGVPELGVEPDAVEVARQRADVGRDRHPVVVEQDDDRRALAAGLMHGLERHAAGQRAVADDRDDVPVLAVAAAHRLLDPDRVADRGRGVAGAHDVVLGLVDRAERRQALVLADRVQLIAAAGQDLVRIGLVADVPEDLVARGVEQRVQRDRDLAGAEVGAEMAADLADGVDDVLAHLLRDLPAAPPR